MTSAEAVAVGARERFVKWLEWFVETYPDESGGSFEQLAPKVGVANATISKWRKGPTYPRLDNVVKLYVLIAKAWDGFRIDDLLFRSPPQTRGR